MDKITITRLPENKFKAQVSTSYPPGTIIEAESNDPVDAVTDLLYLLKDVEKHYGQIPKAHLTYEGQKLLELAISSRKEFEVGSEDQEMANELHGV
jgi:hypothetical protein